MAAVFDFDTERDARVREFVDLGLDAIKVAVGEVPASVAVAEVQRAQRVLAGFEADLLAKHVRADGDGRAAEKLLGDGKTSRRETRRRVRRARANAASGGALGSKMASGELSEEQADHIADAADRSDGDAARDPDFVAAIGAADPDRGRQIKDEWLAARETAGGRQSEHDRQRALRRMQSYVSKKHGLGVICAEGDTVAQNRMLRAIQARADQIYRRDGGRDLATGEHPRTRTQREFDAVYELLCGLTTTPHGRTAPSGGAGGTAARAATIPNRATIVVGLTLDHLIGTDPAAIATQPGLGLIPESVLTDYAEHADIVAALFDRNGEPLWLGRTRRTASATQRIALTLRDKGCVRCGAPPSECEVHHVVPWTSPARGATDLRVLALVCTPCHTDLHKHRLTLYRDDTRGGGWKTRPATPEETPAPRRPRPRHPRPGRGERPQQE